MLLSLFTYFNFSLFICLFSGETCHLGRMIFLIWIASNSLSNLSRLLKSYLLKRLYLSKYLTLYYGISYYFFETLTVEAVRGKIFKWLYWNLRKKWWKMSVMVTIFSNDESTTLLKGESTKVILIGQVGKS